MGFDPLVITQDTDLVYEQAVLTAKAVAALVVGKRKGEATASKVIADAPSPGHAHAS